MGSLTLVFYFVIGTCLAGGFCSFSISIFKFWISFSFSYSICF